MGAKLLCEQLQRTRFNAVLIDMPRESGKRLAKKLKMNYMKTIREKTGLSQKEFAKKLEIPQRTIENWEEEKRTPATYIVKLIEYRINNEYNDKQN